MELVLKKYQTEALEALETFFEGARGAADGAQVTSAFENARRISLGEAAPAVPYRPLGEQPATPQVCFRIPTGGGKTLLAAHAIERAARLFVGTRTPLALWLVPTNTIRTQTLDALKKAGHPYREALLQYYPADRLTVIDIADCEQLRPQDFEGRAIVVVGTIQTLRVGETASRDVYSYKEAFEPHFTGIPDAEWLERISEADLQAQPYLSKSTLGKVKHSFANLLAYYRPIVIVDEAHNARTSLSIEVFKRIRPACLIEWTATPAPDQNVLYHVSAQELKAESMIKLPIVLSPHPNWQEAVRDALLTREGLAKQAGGEADYIRPIILFQADAKGGEVPVDTLKAYLQEQHHIDARRIAVATGAQRELDGIDLFARDCPIEVVITVEALKEGWDCSFAYVFCTVQNIRSARDMEQLLGRVLRLPYAHRRAAEPLNRAYAHVCSPNTALVANQLADRLVSMGFEELEAAQYVQPELGKDLFGQQKPEFKEAQTVVVLPDEAARALEAAAPGVVTVQKTAEGAQVTLRGVLPQEALDKASEAVPKREREDLEKQLERHQARAHAAAAPAQRGERFARIPQLCVSVQGELALLEPDLLAEIAKFSLGGLPADLPSFAKEETKPSYLIDIERGHTRIGQDNGQYALDLDASGEGIQRADVIRELDRRVRRNDVLQPDMIAWLGRLVDSLEGRGIQLTYIARHVRYVADAAAKRLKDLEKVSRANAFQNALFGDAKAKLSDRYEFEFDPAIYPARWTFSGRYTFKKHFYPIPGELKPGIKSEETACAIEIDQLSEVRFWVRNLERQPTSFWLPTSTDRFYPDFVVQLKDGRILVAEYKGAVYLSNDDTKEKRTIGEVWAAASKGKCLFAMVTDQNAAGRSMTEQLRHAIA